jgi:hypothetical protein
MVERRLDNGRSRSIEIYTDSTDTDKCSGEGQGQAREVGWGKKVGIESTSVGK